MKANAKVIAGCRATMARHEHALAMKQLEATRGKCRHGYVPADSCVVCHPPAKRDGPVLGLDGEPLTRKAKT